MSSRSNKKDKRVEIKKVLRTQDSKSGKATKILFFVIALIIVIVALAFVIRTPDKKQQPVVVPPTKKENFSKILRWGRTGVSEEYKEVVKQYFPGYRFEDHDLQPNSKSKQWNITWGDCFPQELLNMEDYQRCGAFPSTAGYANKVALNQLISRIQAYARSLRINFFEFWPESFNLSNPYHFEKVRHYYRTYPKNAQYPLAFIIKQPLKHRGRGIDFVTSLEELDQLGRPGGPAFPMEKTQPLAQRYITNPLLYRGFKPTLRAWVLITSYDPLTIYLYEDGIIKFAPKQFSTTDFNIFRHVASYAMLVEYFKGDEKKFQEFCSLIGLSNGRGTWTQYFAEVQAQNGINITRLKREIEHLVIGSIVAAEQAGHKVYKQFIQENREFRLRNWNFFGFDILVDANGRPHLLEINYSPDLPTAKETLELTHKMMLDTMEVLDFDDKDYGKTKEITERLQKCLKKAEAIDATADSPLDLLKTIAPGQTKDQLWGLVNDEFELERAKKTGWKRLCPQFKVSSEWLSFVHGPTNPAFHRWYQHGYSLVKLFQRVDATGECFEDD